MNTINTMQLANRLGQLGEDLGRFDAMWGCPWEIAQMFNVLLEQAKAERPDDAVVAIIPPLTQLSHSDGFADESCGVVKAYVSQLQSALNAI